MVEVAITDFFELLDKGLGKDAVACGDNDVFVLRSAFLLQLYEPLMTVYSSMTQNLLCIKSSLPSPIMYATELPMLSPL